MITNYKTTIAGCAGAACLAASKIIETGTIDYQTIITAVIVAILGFLAKDFNVTGGTVAQNGGTAGK
jgi:hypothetical protein